MSAKSVAAQSPVLTGAQMLKHRFSSSILSLESPGAYPSRNTYTVTVCVSVCTIYMHDTMYR